MHDRIAWIVGTAISVALYAAVAISIPTLLARLPPDYFVRPPPQRSKLTRVARAILGLVLIAAGAAMLFLPGPGVLTIVLGLSVLGGRLARKALRRLVGQEKVLAAINAMRGKRGEPPLLPPTEAARRDDSA
jgi:hypothetical protein